MSERRRARPGEARGFAEMAAQYTGDDCLLWPFNRSPNGYGVIWLGDGRATTAHRLVLELADGLPPSDGHQAAHAPAACHTRLCVNPHHLRWASPVENWADRRVDNTETIGRRNGQAKLTEEQVRAIRVDPRAQRLIAADHGVSRALVSFIKNRRMWAHLD